MRFPTMRPTVRRRPATRRRLVLVALVPLILGLAACSDDEDKRASVTDVPTNESGDPLAPIPLEEPATVTMAMSSRLEAFAPALLAEHFGEFEKENITVELKFIPTAESTLLVAQGNIDFASGAFTAGTFNLIGQGSPFRFFFPGVAQPDESTQGFWINKKNINPDGGELTADMFKGKKVLTPSGDGSPSAYRLYDWLVKTLPGGDHLKAKDLELEAFDPTTAAQALKTGAADAAQINSPFNLTLEGDSCCEFLKGAQPSETVSAYFIGPSMTDHADVAAGVARAMARTTIKYLPADYRDKPETMQALAEVLELDLKTLESLPPLYWDPTFQTNVDSNLGGQSFFRDRGLLQYDKELTADDVYDSRYLEAIGAAQK